MKIHFLSIVALVSSAACAEPTLTYHCTFDSEDAVTNPAVGNVSQFIAGKFVDGKFGKALQVPACSRGVKVPIPKGTIRAACGTIEFWDRIDDTSTTYVTPSVIAIDICREQDNLPLINLGVRANGGSGDSGFIAGLPPSQHCSSFPTKWGTGTYASLFPKGDWQVWHHYALVWDKDGIAGLDGACGAVYLDGEVLLTAPINPSWDPSYLANYDAFLAFGGLDTAAPHTIDEVKVWDGVKTTFDLNPSPTLPVVSEVVAKQQYPWTGKVDVSYKVTGGAKGLVVKMTAKDTENDIEYEMKSLSGDISVEEGVHNVVWDATTDKVTKMTKSLVVTVSLVLPAN